MPIAEVPQTNKMHAVPQNIMDVEFKLIGDLTLRQFLYLLIFGGAAYVSTVVMVGLFKWPVVIVFAVLGVGLAFVPIQERGLDEWIVNFVRSVYSPTQRIWRREPSIPSAFMSENLAVVKQELITLAPTSSRRKLEEYLEYQVTSTVVDPLDIPERQYMLKVRDAFSDYVPPTQQAPSVGVGVLEPIGEPSENQEPPVAQGPEKPSVEPVEIMGETKSPEPAQNKLPASETTMPRAQHTQQPQIKHRQKQHRTNMPLTPMTPDRHSGRRFINLVPASGELVLPIRGERVIKTSEQEDFEVDIKEKAEKLQQLLAQIQRDDSSIKMPASQQAQPAVQTPPQQAEIGEEAQSLAAKLKTQQEKLDQEISKLETEKTAAKNETEVNERDATIRRLKVEQERTRTDYEALQKQILDLQNKLKLQESVAPQTPKPDISASYGNYSTTQPGVLTAVGKPNLLQGLVRTKTGSTLEGILIIVKNQKGEAVRAVKTDSLGHFKLTTPLANGMYTVQVTGDNLGSAFDIISVEVKGEPINSVEIFGK